MEFKPLKSLEVYLQSLVETRLWIKVIVSLVLGVGAGIALGPSAGWVDPNIASQLGDWLALPGKLFMKLVQMIMIPLIFASIITGLVSTSIEQLKKMGVGVGVYFIITTALSIAIGVILALVIKPGSFFAQTEEVALPQDANEPTTEGILQSIPNAISEILPDNPLASMVSGEMLAIVVFTLIIGVAMMQLSEELKRPLMKVMSAVQEICMTVVKWAMRLVPFAVFGLMTQLVANLGLRSLAGIGYYILTVLAGLLVLMIVYLLIVSIWGKRNPLTFLFKIKEVQLLAFSTTSSAAVMPLSIKTAQDELNISKETSNFLIPVGATVNMDGTAVYQSVSALFIAQAYGLELGLMSIILMMLTIVAASIGTPSIPGGGVVILASVLGSVGIPTEGIVIIIGVERILGMFRTAINVTGDLTACTFFDRWKQTST